MNRHRPSLCAIPLLVACCLVLPFAAGDSVAEPPGPACAASDAGADHGPHTDSYCEVDCGSSIISVDCQGDCEAIDRNCAAGERGRVKCNGTTTSICPTCPVQSCTVGRFCPDGTYIECTSTAGDCLGGGELCFVRCDGVYTFCPGQPAKLIC